MDAQARKKELFRAKLKAQKKDKRIDSALVRYNEFDQPVCRVCDVVLKSESQWDAHQASRKHHEAINKIKANAAAQTQVNNVKPETRTEPHKPHGGHSTESHNVKLEPSTKLPKPQSSTSVLPPNFFDDNGAKRQKTGGSAQTELMETLTSKEEKDGLPSDSVQMEESRPARELTQTTTHTTGSEAKQVKGALPEGFFDKKEDDLRARGIKPVKLDVKDEYKEFEKLIQEDLQDVENRLEEEEYNAAEMIEEAESLEQKAYREKVEMLKKKKLEFKAASSAKRSRGSEVVSKESSHEDSSDDDSEENFAVDWRAQHL